jgi:hypothetical protein
VFEENSAQQILKFKQGIKSLAHPLALCWTFQTHQSKHFIRKDSIKDNGQH